MHFGLIAGAVILYTALVLWAGLKWGNKLEADAREELNLLRAKLSNMVAPTKKA